MNFNDFLTDNRFNRLVVSPMLARVGNRVNLRTKPRNEADALQAIGVPASEAFGNRYRDV